MLRGEKHSVNYMTHALTKRHSFAKIDEVMEMPHLYNWSAGD